MSWDAFTAKVLDIANARGHDFVKTATHPSPEADGIDAWYAIQVEVGPAGYVTKHGQRYELE